MSVPFGFPAWRKFLEDTAPRDTTPQRILNLLNHGQRAKAQVSFTNYWPLADVKVPTHLLAFGLLFGCRDRYGLAENQGSAFPLIPGGSCFER